MKRLTIEEEIAVAVVLAKQPAESLRSMWVTDREDGILQMLRDLYQLATKDGCVAAAWAHEFTVTQAVLADFEHLGRLIPHDWKVWQLDDESWWCGPNYETTVKAYRADTGEEPDIRFGVEPLDASDFATELSGEWKTSPEENLLRRYLINKPGLFAACN